MPEVTNKEPNKANTTPTKTNGNTAQDGRKFIGNLTNCITSQGTFDDTQIEALTSQISTESSIDLLCEVANLAVNVLSGDKTPEKEIAANILANLLVERLCHQALKALTLKNVKDDLAKYGLGDISGVADQVVAALRAPQAMGWLKELLPDMDGEFKPEAAQNMDSDFVAQAAAFNETAKNLIEAIKNTKEVQQLLEVCKRLGSLTQYEACQICGNFAEGLSSEIENGAGAKADKDTSGQPWSFKELFEDSPNGAEVFRGAISAYTKYLSENLTVSGRKDEIVKAVLSDYNGAAFIFNKAIAKFDGDTKSIGLIKSDPESSKGMSAIVNKAIAEIMNEGKPEEPKAPEVKEAPTENKEAPAQAEQKPGDDQSNAVT